MSLAAAGDAISQAPRPPTGRGVVLHVEDDKALAESVRALLKAHGYEVLMAEDGTAAIGWLARGACPDLLIVDFNLPGEMDGVEVAEAVRQLSGQAVPTIILSGQLPNSSAPWLPGTPIFPVPKPVDPEILLGVIDAFVTLGRFIRAQRGSRRGSAQSAIRP